MNAQELIKQGMQKYFMKYQEAGITPRENMLMAYHHKTPVFLPNTFLDAGIVTPCNELERYTGMEDGYDSFGVHWVFVPEDFAPMTVSGEYVLEDIADWKEVVKFPDLDSIDWKAQADLDIHMDSSGQFTGEGVKRFPEGQDFITGGNLRLH